jgi:signal transduction histidine kinase
MGAELITSDDVALNELIKNAFDARSPRVELSIQAPADAYALAVLRDRFLSERSRRLTSDQAAKALEEFSAALSPDLSSKERAALIAECALHLHDATSLEKFLTEFLSLRFKIVVKDTGVGMSASDLETRFMVIGTPVKFIAKQNAGPNEPLVLGIRG